MSSMSKVILTQKHLRQILNYDPETGSFLWRIRKEGINKLEAGHITKCGYHSIMINKINYRSHRLAWVYVYGSIPHRMQIDHINHDRSDNRIANLRLVTNQENQRNRRYTGNSSGVIGVCFDKARSKWKPHIKVDQKLINLGRFNTLEEAIAIRKAAEVQYGFHANHGEHIIY